MDDLGYLSRPPTGQFYSLKFTYGSSTFVTQKIIGTVKRISNGSGEKLVLGRIDIARDWGWAPEYVEAMWLMLQQDKAEDFVIATGKTFTLQEFIRLAFAEVGLDWTEYVTQADEFMRPTDILVSSADPSKALAKLDWKAEIDMPNVVKLMMRS